MEIALLHLILDKGVFSMVRSIKEVRLARLLLFICVLVLLGSIKGISQMRGCIVAKREMSSHGWLEQCSKVQTGMSNADVVAILGEPEESLANAHGNPEMYYRAPNFHPDRTEAHKLVPYFFYVTFENGVVTNFGVIFD